MRWNLQEADAQDVTQSVLLKLPRTLPDFSYDPSKSFRGWLRTLTYHAWSDFISNQRRGVRGTGDSAVADMLESIPARDDLILRLQKGFDQELMEEAMVRVRERVDAHTWEAFQLTAVELLKAGEVAERLGMNVTTVYRSRSVVQRMLREVVAELGGEEEPAT